MTTSLRTLFIVLFLALGMSACDRDTSISESDGGAKTGDGGVGSKQFAGTYDGNLHIIYKGDGVDGSDDLATTVKINTNGTVSLTVRDEAINGVINNNKVDIGLEVSRTEDGIKCKGEITITATVNGAIVSGPLHGDADCRLVTIKRSADLSGSIHVIKR